jgi:hypothetical protein
MARQNINYGTNANDGTGDNLRVAMDKINDNFIELYSNSSQNVAVSSTGITNSTINGNISLDTNGTGTVQTTQGLLVNTGNENSNSIFYASDGSNLLTVDVQNKRLGVNKSTPTATVDVTGTANISGNVGIASSITLGSTSSDRVTINSKLFGNLIPGTSYTIGSSSEKWTNVYATTIDATEINVANVAATLVTATQFTGDVVGNLVTSNDITINNGALSTRINTETLTAPRAVNFPDLSGTVVTKNNGRMAGPFGSVPGTLVGVSGDKQGNIAFDADYMYYCTADYDGSTNVWKKISLSATGVTDTLTSISYATNTISYVDEAGNTTNIDLSSLLDDTNLARITVGTFDINTGVLSLVRDDSSSVTVDLDGRYLAYSNNGVPATSVGAAGDVAGDFAADADYFYYCTADYDGSTAIWKRTALSTW